MCVGDHTNLACVSVGRRLVGRRAQNWWDRLGLFRVKPYYPLLDNYIMKNALSCLVRLSVTHKVGVCGTQRAIVPLPVGCGDKRCSCPVHWQQKIEFPTHRSVLGNGSIQENKNCKHILQENTVNFNTVKVSSWGCWPGGIGLDWLNPNPGYPTIQRIRPWEILLLCLCFLFQGRARESAALN